MDDGESAPVWFSDPHRPDSRNYYLHHRHQFDQQEQQEQQDQQLEDDEGVMDPSMMMGMMMMDEDERYGGEESYCMSYADYGADPNINWEERCMELEMSLQRFRDQAGKIRGLLREKVSKQS